MVSVTSELMKTDDLKLFTDAVTTKKYDPLLSDKLSLPKVIKTLENELSLLTSSNMKSVNDKRVNKITVLSDKHKRAMNNGIKNEIKRFINHLIYNVFTKLVTQVKHFKTELQYEKEISKIIYGSQRNYSSKLQKYNERLMNYVNPIYEIDMHLMMLDLIEKSNKLFLTECRDILSLIYNQSPNKKYNAYQYKVFALLENLLKYIVEFKKEEIEYVCEHYQVCRKYPAYSYYISDVIKELLNLPDAKLRYFIMNLRVLLQEQANLFKSILSEDLVFKLGCQLKFIFNDDMGKVRTALVELREVIADKHKLRRSNDDTVMKQSKSITMLIDMIDKAFDRTDAEILSIYFDNSLQKIRDWGKTENQDITVDLGHFMRHFADNIKYNWKPETHREVNAIVEVILMGNATDEDTYDYLFTKGPKYLNLKPEIDFDL